MQGTDCKPTDGFVSPRSLHCDAIAFSPSANLYLLSMPRSCDYRVTTVKVLTGGRSMVYRLVSSLTVESIMKSLSKHGSHYQ